MDQNQSAVLIALITSVTTIILATLQLWKSNKIQKDVAANNVVTKEVHTIANGRTDKLMADLAEARKRIEELALMVPPEKL